MNLTDQTSNSISPAEQEQIDRITGRFAEIVGCQPGRMCTKAEEPWSPWDEYEVFQNERFQLRKKSLARTEIDSLNQDPPMSSRTRLAFLFPWKCGASKLPA